jgi:hypothetical protein
MIATPDLYAVLEAADDPDTWEMPASFPWRSELERIRQIKPRLDKVIGRAFVLDDGIQDSAAFAELRVEGSPNASNVIQVEVGVTFSAFGRLVSIWSSPSCVVPERLTEELATALGDLGYVYVPSDVLERPYDGRCVLRDRIPTWADRFFGYS